MARGSGRRRQSRCSRLANVPSSSGASTSSTAHDGIDEIVIALPPALASVPPAYLISARKPVRIVDGGIRRQDSVAKAFAQVSKSAEVIVIHDAARPFASADLFTRVIEAAKKGGAAIAALQASDTVKEATAAPGVRIVARTIARESIYLAQTPQAFNRAVLEAAIEFGRVIVGVRDRRSVARRAGWLHRKAGGRRIDEHQDHDGTGSCGVKSAHRDQGFGIEHQRTAASRHRIRPASPGSRAGGSLLVAWRFRTRRDLPAIPMRMCCVMP